MFRILHFTGKGDKQVIRINIKGQFLQIHIIARIWPITHMCGQHWGRDGDRHKDWQALIPASCGHCYCSPASQMSATWLILPLADSLPFHCVVRYSFRNPPPPKCAAQTTAAKVAIQLAAEH